MWVFIASVKHLATLFIRTKTTKSLRKSKKSYFLALRGVKKAHMASQEQKMTQETTEQLAEKFMQKVLAIESRGTSGDFWPNYSRALVPMVFVSFSPDYRNPIVRYLCKN